MGEDIDVQGRSPEMHSPFPRLPPKERREDFSPLSISRISSQSCYTQAHSWVYMQRKISVKRGIVI